MGGSLILQAFSNFTYVTAHSDSPSFPSLYLRHSSFPNPSLALPTSQLILQPFLCFTYVTAHSPTLLSPLLRHRIFTYVTWRAAHDLCDCVNNGFISFQSRVELLLFQFGVFGILNVHNQLNIKIRKSCKGYLAPYNINNHQLQQWHLYLLHSAYCTHN